MPPNPYRRQPNINDMMYPKGSKQPRQVWAAVMNVPQPSSGAAVTPTPTPSNTPTGTIPVTPTPTNTPTNTTTPTGTPNPTTTPTNTTTPTTTLTSTPTNTPTPSSTPPTPGLAEANTYLSAVVDAGGTGITPTVSAATRTLFTSLFSNNIWNSLTAFYPILGGVQNSHAINGKNPGTNNLTFNGGWTHNASGMTGNGSTGFANTGINDSTLTDNRHVSIYSRTNSISGCVDIGCINPSTTFGTFLQLRMTDVISRVGVKSILGQNQSDAYDYANASSSGFFIVTSPSNRDVYQNGTLRVSLGNVAGNGTLSVYIGAINSNNTAIGFSNRQYCFASLGTNISSVATTFSTIINTYQTSLGRNTY